MEEFERGLRYNRNLSLVLYDVKKLKAVNNKYGYKQGDLPVTENISDCLLRLPFFNDLEEDQLAEICKEITSVKSQ